MEKKKSSTRVNPELNTRFLCNDPEKPLTWEEFDALWEFYFDLECKLSVLGRDFYLALKEVQRRMTKLNFTKDQMKQREKKAHERS